MSELSRYLLVLSPLRPSNAALVRAAALAKAAGKPLHVAAFDYLEGLATLSPFNRPFSEPAKQEYLQRHRQWLEAQVVPLRGEGLVITTEVTWLDDPYRQILEHLREQPIELVIKEVEQVPWLTRLIFTTLDSQLLLGCGAPLYFIDPTGNVLPQRILAAVDPFHTSDGYQAMNDRILHEAVKLAGLCHATIDVVYAHDLCSMRADEFETDSVRALLSSHQATTLFTAQAEAFGLLAQRHGIAEHQRHLIVGNPAKVLINYVNVHHVDVVVMGRVARSSRARTVGSTAQQLVNAMPCSLWMVVPEDLAGEASA